MNQILYEKRCKCKEILLTTKKPKVKKRTEGRLLKYPIFDDSEPIFDDNESKVDDSEPKVTSFQVLFDHDLTLETKFLLTSFQKKYLYHAIDDILYTLNLNLNERIKLLGILYNPTLSLQNSFSVDFFDIWIHELHIKKVSKSNRFMVGNVPSLYKINITILYRVKSPPIVEQPLW